MNWIVGNLQNALDTWNGKLSEIYSLVTQSPADFVSKMTIALKEANETKYWLTLLEKADYMTAKEFESISKDLRIIIGTLVNTIKKTKE